MRRVARPLMLLRTALSTALISWGAAVTSMPARAELPPLQNSKLDLRWQGQDLTPSDLGPWAGANRLAPGIATQPSSLLALEAQWSARLGAVQGAVYAQHSQAPGKAASSSARVQELFVNASRGDWHVSAGRKILSWDVGYAFRPNDTVQREERRTLVDSFQQGRPLLQAETFDADSAWSAVWVNPGHGAQALGAEEEALALRYYRHAGSADWHGFARWGRAEHLSLGAAVSWVASDAVELHGSARVAQQASVWRLPGTAPLVNTASPWQREMQTPSAQWLLGGTWTNEAQLSVIAEVWWDAQAMSGAQWREWHTRNQTLQALATQAPPALQSAIAGQLAWQSQAWSNSSLRRSNVYARLSWTTGAWQWAADTLWMPEDGGLIQSVSLQWSGNRWQINTGLRRFGGPSQSVAAQLPQRQTAFVAADWSY